MSAQQEARARFPKKLKYLFEKHRYKVAYGGRGSSKSWSFARALLMLGIQEIPIRVLCAREVQKSIKQSVHTLLCDQIQALGLGAFYDPLETEIRGKNGTTFTFTGLNVHTVESIKSFEGCDICWVEEGQTVSKKSWDILIPTIRKDGSEIWVSFNPDLDTDDTFVRFVENPPPDSMVIKVNYTDNPWFPEVLEKERLHAKRTKPADEYANIWEGACKAAVEGAIYANEIRAALEQRRICNVPYDSMLKVHVVFDLGWNDKMFISLVQRGVADIRVIDCIVDDHRTLDYYSSILKEKRLNWGKMWLPHDGETKDYKIGKSARQIMERHGWDVKIVPKLDVESGIRVARETFGRFYFDKAKAAPLVSSLKRYKRVVSSVTNEPGDPQHDEASHGADNYRYICVSAEQMSNEDAKKIPATQSFRPSDPGMGY